MWGWLGQLIKPVTTIAAGWQERKTRKMELEMEVEVATAKARIARLEAGQAADIAWEANSIDRATWKDELWTLVLAAPLVMCFLPGFDVYVTAGFAAINNTPDWYKWALSIAIASAFGYRKFADGMALVKGAKRQ